MELNLRSLVKLVTWVITFGFAYSSYLIVSADPPSRDEVDYFCETVPGTPVDDIIQRAFELEYSGSNTLGLTKSMSVFSKDHNKPYFFDEDSVPEVDSGYIIIGQSRIPPFMNNYCTLSFSNRRVTWTHLSKSDILL